MANYKEDIVDIELESGSIHRSWLNHSIGLGDIKANRFGVRVFRNKTVENISSCTCEGFFMRPDGTNLLIQGSTYTAVSGNVAYVTLPQDCYAYEGQFTLAIKVINSGDGITATLRIVDGMVDNTGATGAVSPTSTIPTSAEIIAAYNTAVAVIDGSVRHDIVQSLTNAQKATARTNIEAASEAEASALDDQIQAVANGLPYTLTGNTVVLYDTGETATGDYYTKWKSTDYIEIAGNSVLHVTGHTNKDYFMSSDSTGMAFYDAGKVYISGVKYRNSQPMVIPVPDNAAYARFSRFSNSVGDVFENMVIAPYYIGQIPDLNGEIVQNHIVWHPGNYNANTGEIEGTTIPVNYYRTDKMSYVVRNLGLLKGWDEGDWASFMSLWKNGVYVGYISSNAYHDTTGATVTPIDYDEIALNLYVASIEAVGTGSVDYIYIDLPGRKKYDDSKDFDGLDYIHEWQTGAYSLADGTYDSTNTSYRCSVDKIPKKLFPLITGFNMASSTSFLALYLDGILTGAYYNSHWHSVDQSGTTRNYIIFDEFTINVHVSDTQSRNARIISNGSIDQRISNSNIVTTHTISVTTAAELIAAVNTAITGESDFDVYDINMSSGTYELWEVLDKDEISGTGDQWYHRGLELPNHCNLHGIGTVVLSCTIPESDNSDEHPYTRIVSTLNMHNTENVLENIHFVGNNTRYCIHDDSGFGITFKQLTVLNCKFTHNGTASELYMPDPRCYGAGFVTGRKAYFNNCIFESAGNCDKQLYVHTHQGTSNISDIETYVNDCAFITPNKTPIHYQIPWNTSYGGRLTINNSYFASGSVVLLDSLVGSVVFGGGNSAFTIDNQNQSTIYLVP